MDLQGAMFVRTALWTWDLNLECLETSWNLFPVFGEGFLISRLTWQSKENSTLRQGYPQPPVLPMPLDCDISRLVTHLCFSDWVFCDVQMQDSLAGVVLLSWHEHISLLSLCRFNLNISFSGRRANAQLSLLPQLHPRYRTFLVDFITQTVSMPRFCAILEGLADSLTVMIWCQFCGVLSLDKISHLYCLIFFCSAIDKIDQNWWYYSVCLKVICGWSPDQSNDRCNSMYT